MSEANQDGGIRNVYRGGEGVYEEEGDCGILVACDKGDDDSQLEWE